MFKQVRARGSVMKVGIIGPQWAAIPPVGHGGTEVAIDQLARGLVLAGHEVVQCTVGDSTRSCASELRHVVAAYEAMVDADVDIIHDHTMAGLMLASTPGFVDIPVVTTNHGPFNDELNDLYERVSRSVGVIAISHDQARQARGVQIAGVIHHGVDPDAFPVGSGDGGYFLFLGSMTREQGAHRAIEIARTTDRPLLITAQVRDASERGYFETEIEPLLGNGIEFVGEVAGERKLQLLADAVALLNPTRRPEQFGMVMIESLACGTPVLSFREGAAPEIITHGVDGILADTEAELVLAASLVHRLDRRACRDKVLTEFTTSRLVAAHLVVYQAECERHHDNGMRLETATLLDAPHVSALNGIVSTTLTQAQPALQMLRTPREVARGF